MHVYNVGGTQKLMMAKTLARGPPRLFDTACEPELVELDHFFNGLGAKVTGQGTTMIEIVGVAQRPQSQSLTFRAPSP